MSPKQDTEQIKENIKNKKVKSFSDAPNKPKDYSINPNDRVFITGKTGSGKTTLVKYLLATAPRLIVIDGKNGLSKNWNLEDYLDNRENKNKIERREDFRFRLVDNFEDIITVLNLVYTSATEETKSVIIYIDEITATLEPKIKVPSIFRDIWTRGRSKNIGGWSNTQRPTDVSLFFISEAEHLFEFSLNLENDRKRLATIGGKGMLIKPRDKFGFYYYNVSNDELKYYSKMRI